MQFYKFFILTILFLTNLLSNNTTDFNNKNIPPKALELDCEDFIPYIIFSTDTNDFFFKSSIIGGKALNLKKLEKIKDISISPWFVITSKTLKLFLVENKIIDQIEELDHLCINTEKNIDAIKYQCKKIQNLIRTKQLSSHLYSVLANALEEFEKRDFSITSFAIRSSGLIEDSSKSSCAGLFDTVLNCKELDQIINALLQVWSSSYDFNVVLERAKLNISQTEPVMAVVVQKLINAQISGVATSMVLSTNYPGIEIIANYGFGESVVRGDISVDRWVVHPAQNYILEQTLGNKNSYFIKDKNFGIIEEKVNKEKRKQMVLSNEQVHQLAKIVKNIQNEYQNDIDLEYSIDENNTIFILQVRPLVNNQTSELFVIDKEKTKLNKIIAKGLYSTPKVAIGKLVFVKSLEELSDNKIQFQKDDIVLAYITTNVWSQYFTNIGGLITKEGSSLSHPILLSREKGIACLIGLDNNFEALTKLDGKIITLDGINQSIYEGQMPLKKATIEDLQDQFKIIKPKPSFNLENNLPALIHNKMVIYNEGKYWRKTPTFTIKGIELEVNINRFSLISNLVGNETVKINAKALDNYCCNELKSYQDYIDIFKDYSLKRALQFNNEQEKAINDFIKFSYSLTFNKKSFDDYIKAYSLFRAYVWLGASFRELCETKVNKIASAIELPEYYLEASSNNIQSEITELDTDMHQEIYQIASMYKNYDLPDAIEKLKNSNKIFYENIEDISKKYRFEHEISLDKPINLQIVYERIKKEIDAIKKGASFTSQKIILKNKSYLVEFNDLALWLKLSINNRILQSNSHHIEARSRAIVRDKMLAWGQILKNNDIINDPNEIFSLSSKQIMSYLKE